jgi:hypothetical protein
VERKNKLKDIYEQHPLLSVGVVSSLIILVAFLLLQHNEAKVLGLDSRWLFVSFLPLLVALLVGGYIKSFKGFGVELEARLKNPVTSVSLTATDAAEELVGDEKRSRNYLNLILERERPYNSYTSRLIFIKGRRDYYSAEIIVEYIRALRGLKYIEVREENGEFIALIPISKMKINNEVDSQKVSLFIESLENETLFPLFRAGANREFVNESTNLVEALRLMRKTDSDQIAVVSDDKHFIGLLSARDVEKRIADEVLASKHENT